MKFYEYMDRLRKLEEEEPMIGECEMVVQIGGDVAKVDFAVVEDLGAEYPQLDRCVVITLDEKQEREIIDELSHCENCDEGDEEGVDDGP